MKLRGVIASCVICCLAMLSWFVVPASAGTDASTFEQTMSECLDLWRDGRYEQLYERLAHRGRTSREQFVKKMHDSSVRPACCWQKMENFKVLNEKRTEATVYARIGLEGDSNAARTCTREFKLTHEEGVWKMQLNDVYALSGASGKKGNRNHTRKSTKNTSSYHQ
jgi:hypothetical protein